MTIIPSTDPNAKKRGAVAISLKDPTGEFSRMLDEMVEYFKEVEKINPPDKTVLIKTGITAMYKKMKEEQPKSFIPNKMF